LEDSKYRIIRCLFIIGEAVAIAVFCHPRRRTARMGRLPCLVRAEVRVVGDAVAISVPGPGVGRAVVFRPPWVIGAEVIGVRDAVVVPVGTASVLGQARLTRTVVVHIANAVAVTVGAASVLGQARLLRAVVLGIGDAVTVHVPFHRAAIILGQARLSGAGVFGVGDAVVISVGATVGPRRAGFVGAGVGLIEDAIAIPILLAR
jgi:hypothetical protein